MLRAGGIVLGVGPIHDRPDSIASNGGRDVPVVP